METNKSEEKTMPSWLNLVALFLQLIITVWKEFWFYAAIIIGSVVLGVVLVVFVVIFPIVHRPLIRAWKHSYDNVKANSPMQVRIVDLIGEKITQWLGIGIHK